MAEFVVFTFFFIKVKANASVLWCVLSIYFFFWMNRLSIESQYFDIFIQFKLPWPCIFINIYFIFVFLFFLSLFFFLFDYLILLLIPYLGMPNRKIYTNEWSRIYACTWYERIGTIHSYTIPIWWWIWAI